MTLRKSIGEFDRHGFPVRWDPAGSAHEHNLECRGAVLSGSRSIFYPIRFSLAESLKRRRVSTLGSAHGAWGFRFLQTFNRRRFTRHT